MANEDLFVNLRIFKTEHIHKIMVFSLKMNFSSPRSDFNYKKKNQSKFQNFAVILFDILILIDKVHMFQEGHKN